MAMHQAQYSGLMRPKPPVPGRPWPVAEQAIQKIGQAIRVDGGMEAVNLKVAEEYVRASVSWPSRAIR
ncbi:hypothetical protein AWV80_18490 [Cupriavidus sp. UYMU48A]|nr:hypothetical protein AWV80_18490 [Cupriavidus sp. UYMU48A]